MTEQLIQNIIKEITGCEEKVAIDIGANLGDYSKQMSPNFKKVYAFEPHPDNIKEMAPRIEQFSNIEVKQGVISKIDGQIKLYINKDNPGGHSVNPVLAEKAKWGHSFDNFIMVDSWRLDTFAKDMDVGLIKIDVEAAEEEVLRSGEQMLIRCHPIIGLETHSTINTKAIFNFLTNCGYKIYEQNDRALERIEINKHYRCI